MRLNPRSIRFRLTALYVTFFGATLIIFSSVLYKALIRTHQRDFDIDLYNYAVDVADGINLDLLGNLSIMTEALSNPGKIVPFTMGNSFIQILDSHGNLIARSRTLENNRLPFYTEDRDHLLEQKVSLRTIERKQIFPKESLNRPDHRYPTPSPEVTSYRMISYNVIRNLTNHLILQIAVPTTFLDQAAQGLTNFLLFGIPITLVISMFAGYYFASQALNPVNSIISKAKQLSPKNLSERIPLPPAPADDELKNLSITLNDLLDRLEQAFKNQERFIADASHELKTPLAILRGELDLIKSRPRSTEEISEFMVSASQELDHLSSVVEDLLLLARVDAGTELLTFHPIRIDEAALEAVSRMEILARNQEIRLRFEMQNQNQSSQISEFEILGDADLLRIMIKNLVENAIKFSPKGSVIDIRLIDHGHSVVFSVKDQGPGISESFQTKIFERFFRVIRNGPGSNSQNTPSGAGLGLAIASRIAQAHHGTLEVQSKTEPPGQTGTLFTATLLRENRDSRH